MKIILALGHIKMSGKIVLPFSIGGKKSLLNHAAVSTVARFFSISPICKN